MTARLMLGKTRIRPAPKVSKPPVTLSKIPKRPEVILQELHNAWYEASCEGRHGDALAALVEYRAHLRNAFELKGSSISRDVTFTSADGEFEE